MQIKLTWDEFKQFAKEGIALTYQQRVMFNNTYVDPNIASIDFVVNRTEGEGSLGELPDYVYLNLKPMK